MPNSVGRSFEDLDRLLDAYLDGVASPEQVQALERLIVGEDEAAAHVSERCLAHRQISDLLAEEKLHSILSQYGEGLPRLPRPLVEQMSGLESVDRSVEQAPRVGGPAQSRHWGAAATVAAVAASLALWAWLPPAAPLASMSPENVAPVAAAAPRSPADRHDAGVAATITRLIDAQWVAGAPAYHYGQQLPNSSRVRLVAGRAKVTFECGAEVMLEGPCDFTVRDKMVGLLKQGSLAANVPRRAFAFAILSPGVDFVDLGTSFGISVDKNGGSELHVFEGEVLYSPNAAATAGRNSSVHVEASQAVKFDAEGASTGIAMNEQQFSPLLALRPASAKENAPLKDADLALWLGADAGVSTDPQNRVLAWQDILFDDNRTAEDATQYEEPARPTWAPTAIHGRPAIRFDGTSDYLVTTPLETTDDQTVLVVCQYAQDAFDKSRKWGGQIINYDGPPSREASNIFSPGILQIGEPLLETEFHPSLVSAQVFAGFIGSAVVETGRIDAAPLGAQKPAVIAYRYDYGRGKADLSINGHAYGESRAFAPQALTSRKIIGRHAWKELFFHGDLGELIIFNRALSNQQLAAATEYLAKKYAIQLAAAASPEPAETSP